MFGIYAADAITASSLASAWGRGGGLSIATDVSVRGECRKYSCIPSGGEASLSRQFSARAVSKFVSSVESRSLGWVKSAVGQANASVSSSQTPCIYWSSCMRFLSSDVLDKLVGKFLGDSTYSESTSLSTELSANMTSLSGLVGNLGVTAVTYAGSAWFEFVLPFLMAAGVVVLEAAVLARAWYAWAAPALAAKAGDPSLLVRTEGVNAGASG